MQTIERDFYRTLGVPGDDTPRFPEAPPMELVHADSFDAQCDERAAKDDYDPIPTEATLATWDAIDLSLEATPPSEDLRNILTIVAPLQDSMIREAVTRLAKAALAKIEADQVRG